MEKALRRQIKQLKQTGPLIDKYREKAIDTLPCHIKAETDAHMQTDEMYQVEIILNSQIKELDRKLQEQIAFTEKKNVTGRMWKRPCVAKLN